MKTSTKTKLSIASKAILFAALFAVIACFALLLTACGGDDNDSGNGDAVITKYDATLDASITMIPTQPPVSFADILDKTYITKQNGKYTLTLIFKKGELNVGGMTGTIFVDDNPNDDANVGSVVNGTIGAYNSKGTLVTSGVVKTYTSGDVYELNSKNQNVYYVQSAAMPIDGLRAEYSLTFYVNSAMMGKQFSNESYNAKLTVDLNSGEEVEEINGLGVATRGTVSTQPVDPDEGEEGDNNVAPTENEYTKYAAELNAVVTMGTTDVNYTATLIDSVYVIVKDGKYEITVIFKAGEVAMPYGNTMTGYVNGAPYTAYGVEGAVDPVIGYYDGEELVTDGVYLTYSTGEDYVTNANGSFYYVKSMTFTVDKLSSSYNLALLVALGNDSAASSTQFPYTSSKGVLSNAVLSLDLTQAETTESLDGLLGVDTLGTVEIESNGESESETDDETDSETVGE